MSWRFPFHGESQQQQTQPNFPDIPTQSWYPHSVVSSSRPLTPSSSASLNGHQRLPERPYSPSLGQPSPAEGTDIIARLKDKSVDELRKLLVDKEAYMAFFGSLDEVKDQNDLHDELQKETLHFARKNLENEPRIMELRNQCTIIRTTELATAEEKLTELERQKDEILNSYSPSALLQKLHEAVSKVDEESELLRTKLSNKEIDLPAFLQNYKKLRAVHHRRSLLHLAARTSVF